MTLLAVQHYIIAQVQAMDSHKARGKSRAAQFTSSRSRSTSVSTYGIKKPELQQSAYAAVNAALAVTDCVS
jgi:hypothetical protein